MVLSLALHAAAEPVGMGTHVVCEALLLCSIEECLFL